jgi:hypothetical protein
MGLSGLLVKLLALLTFVGGPLFVADWAREWGSDWAFAVAFAPVGLLAFGSLFIFDDLTDRTHRILVGAGIAGAVGVLFQNAFAVFRFSMGDEHPNRTLIWVGIAGGTPYATMFTVFALRRLSARRGHWAPASSSRPSIEDWVVLAISLAFVASGVLIWPRNRNVAMTTILFFGVAAAVSATTVARKLGFAPTLRRELPYGVPVRQSRVRSGALMGGVFVFGILLYDFGNGYGDVFRGFCLVIAAVGFVGIALLAAGRIPVGYLQFDPKGITVARRRYRVFLPWDSISHVGRGELYRNPVLLLTVRDETEVQVEPASETERAVRDLRRDRGLLGANVMIMTSLYGLDLAYVSSELERFVKQPSARAALVPTYRPLVP